MAEGGKVGSDGVKGIGGGGGQGDRRWWGSRG